MYRHNITVMQQFFKADELCAQHFFSFCTWLPVMIDHFHVVGTFASHCHLKSNAAKPENTKYFIFQFNSEICLGPEISPFSLRNGLMHVKHFARDCYH